MIQIEIENSFDEGEISDTSFSDNESDLETLRQTAILSMIKTESVIDNEFHTVYDIEKQLIECRSNLKTNENVTDFQIDKRSSFINNQKRPCLEIDNSEVKRAKVSDVVKLVENYVGKPLGSSNLLVDKSKQPELKNRLFKILKPTPKKEKVHVNISDGNEGLSADIPLNKISNNSSNELIISDRYASNINEEIKSIDEITASINSMTATIREKLQKSKAISAQIDNMKLHKTDLLKDVTETRSKISYLHKIKKQKLASLAKYKYLKTQCELSPISSLNVEKADSQSVASLDNEELISTSLNCNQIICPLWIDGTCANKQCVYQHPKIPAKPIVMKRAPIKENDKVFLQEMNPLEFITTFHCAACSSLVHLSNLHIIDDWHCKSCCQNVMILSKPIDVLYQLITIWHHTYKRYIISQSVPIGNRTSAVLTSLVKCTDALQAKLGSCGTVSLDLIRLVGRHILTVFSETGRTDDSIACVKLMNYDTNLLLFVTSLSLPVAPVHLLIADSIDHQINKAMFDNIETLITKYCKWSAFVEESPRAALFQWLEMSIKRNIVNNYCDIIAVLTKSLLVDIIGTCDACVLDLSLPEFEGDEKYWMYRKPAIDNLVRLYSYDGETQSYMCLVLNKYRILSLFSTNNEEIAIELCQKYSGAHFYFNILLSRLSLKYNCQTTMDDWNIVALTEHNYSKSEWLLKNRSEKSCAKILENIGSKLYKRSTNLSEIDPLRLYQHFLGLPEEFDATISNLIPTNPDDVSKSIRESSSIWMCYISLSSLDKQEDNLTTLLTSDCLLNLECSHLCRVVTFILEHFTMLYDGEVYFEKLKSTFVRLKKCIDFEHFMNLFRGIYFEKLSLFQLPMWLFLLDFCVRNYSFENRDLFLVEISEKLLFGTEKRGNYDIFSHIVLCYPISVEKVWLNLIQLVLNLNLPLYTLIDVCGSATGRVKYSKSLWRHYINCALKLADQQMIVEVREKAAKMGFSFP